MVFALIQSHYLRIKAFYQKYESWFMPALILWGFIFHYITFKVIPISDVLRLVFGYLALATLTIVFMHLYDMGKVSERLRYVRLFAPLLLQFALGSVMGGVFIFYWFSGSIFDSWPFIAFVVVLIIGLEFYKHYLENPIVQFGLYCFASFLLLAVALPYIITSIDPAWFIIAGFLSLFLSLGLTYLLRNSPSIADRKNHIITICIGIFLVMNGFYFYNVIPPVPLSIRGYGIYHNVQRSGDTYLVSTEQTSFWQRLGFYSTIHLRADERAYAYTAIYSPTNLDTQIVDDWQYYDPTQKRWISESKPSFSLVGGRQEGYRGFSYQAHLQAGKWRVYVETPRGQILGRYQFNVDIVSQDPPLIQESK